MITENGRVIFDGFSHVGMNKTFKMAKYAFRAYQLARFHAVRYRLNRARAAAETDAAAEADARPVLHEDDE